MHSKEIIIIYFKTKHYEKIIYGYFSDLDADEL
jgi:hypothetical protein